jgi:hypothetical protein
LFPDKVFVSAQNVLRRSSSSVRWSGAVIWSFCISVNPSYFPSVVSVKFRQVGIFGEKKLMSENRDMTCFWRGGERKEMNKI